MIDAASLGSLLAFWLTITACGLLAWPLAMLLLPADIDRGYLAAKPLGWLIGAYAAYIASVAGVPFSRFGWLVGLVALAGVFALTLRRPLRLPPLPRILVWETGFVFALLIGTLVKASTPDIQGLEKFMDFAFVNGALRTGTMPPLDPWWAGQPINYYYFGHVAAAWLIQVSRVPADHGFNLMMGALFAFVAMLGYRIVAGCLEAVSRRIAIVCGLVAATLVTFAGNGHSVLYGPLRALSPTTYTRGFFFPDSTRYIGFDPPVDDKAFTEMPAYGFAVGDLHAHVLNLATAFLTALLLTRLLHRAWTNPKVGIGFADAAVLTLLFAISAMGNSWDAVSYGIMMGLVGLLLLIQRGRGWWPRLQLVGWGAAIVAGAVVLALPFLLTFDPIGSYMVWFDGSTPPWQLGVLYAYALVPLAVLLVALLTPLRRDPRWIVGATIAATAVALVVLPEIAYVKDIYGLDLRRANTMFKFTFHAQPLMYLAGMVLVGILLQGRRALAALAALAVSIPLLAPLSYAGDIYGDRLMKLGSRTFSLNGLGFIDRERPEDRPLVDWLRAQPAGERILLLEAAGDSFTQAARLSAMSGVPTLVGWRGHEWLWRGDAGAVYTRSDEIARFYESASLADACRLILDYGVTHVAIGSIERELYTAMDPDLLSRLGTVVAGDGRSRLIAVDVRTCQK